jgi:flagellar hook-length control protein FliK
MNNTINALSAVTGVPDAGATAGVTNDPRGSAFAQLLDQMALQTQQTANDTPGDTTFAGVDAGATPMANVGAGSTTAESGDAPSQTETTDDAPATPDVAMIAALLNQMQTPYLRPAAAVASTTESADSSIHTSPTDTAERTLKTAALAESPAAIATAALPNDTAVAASAAKPLDTVTQSKLRASTSPAGDPAKPQKAQPAAGTDTDNNTDVAPANTAALPEPRIPLTAANRTAADTHDTPHAPRDDLRAAMTVRTAATREAGAATETTPRTFDEALQSAVVTSTPQFAIPRVRDTEHQQTIDPISLTGIVPAATHGANAPAETAIRSAEIAPRLDTPEWRPAFAGGMRSLVQDGVNSASLQLNPAELGPIDVRIVVTDQRADISFMVRTSEANSAIQSALPDLQDQLARSGIQLGQTSVGGQRQDPRAFADTPQRGSTPGPAAIEALGVAPPVARTLAPGQIDTFA